MAYIRNWIDAVYLSRKQEDYQRRTFPSVSMKPGPI